MNNTKHNYCGLMLKFPLHEDFTRDWRYSVKEEWLGYSVPMLAVRFENELIGVARDEEKANHIMQKHHKGETSNEH